MCIATGISRIESLFNLMGVIIIFLLVLAAAYFTSRWIGKAKFLQQNNKNIQVLETFRLNQTKYIQIIRIGKKYIAVGISKEHIDVLAELTEEDLDLSGQTLSQETNTIDFKDVLETLMRKKK